MNAGEELALLDAVGRAGTQDVDIARAALALASFARPGLSLEPYLAHLELLRGAAARIAGLESVDETPARAVAEALAATLHGDFGYDGDSRRYDDLMNADLAHVIDRRRGLPVALGILYIHTARGLGARAHGINFPGHFLVGVATPRSSILIDPFHGGRALDGDALEGLLPRGTPLQSDHLAALSDRGTLIRLQNNIISRTREAGAWERAATALECVARMAPDAGSIHYELAQAYARIEHSVAARHALTRALALDGEAAWAAEARALLSRLTRSLN